MNGYTKTGRTDGIPLRTATAAAGETYARSMAEVKEDTPVLLVAVRYGVIKIGYKQSPFCLH